MRNDVEWLESGDKKYPIRCDLFALQKIQDKFESIETFENLLLGECHIAKKGVKSTREPNIRAIMEGAEIMIEEGNQFLKEEGEQVVAFSKKEFFENLGIAELIAMKTVLYKEFGRCFQTKK